MAEQGQARKRAELSARQWLLVVVAGAVLFVIGGLTQPIGGAFVGLLGLAAAIVGLVGLAWRLLKGR